MGGLTREEVKKVDDKVPFFGDLPLVGRLFRSKGESSQKRNLLIFVTANLVSPGGSPKKAKPQEQRRPIPFFKTQRSSRPPALSPHPRRQRRQEVKCAREPMKRFFRLLLLAIATTIVARAQSVNITSPSGTATSPVNITGTTAGFNSSVTGNLTVVVTSPTGTATSLTTSITGNTFWSITWTPSVAGNYTLTASFQGVSSSTVGVTITGAPTVSSLTLVGGARRCRSVRRAT